MHTDTGGHDACVECEGGPNDGDSACTGGYVTNGIVQSVAVDFPGTNVHGAFNLKNGEIINFADNIVSISLQLDSLLANNTLDYVDIYFF